MRSSRVSDVLRAACIGACAGRMLPWQEPSFPIACLVTDHDPLREHFIHLNRTVSAFQSSSFVWCHARGFLVDQAGCFSNARGNCATILPGVTTQPSSSSICVLISTYLFYDHPRFVVRRRRQSPLAGVARSPSKAVFALRGLWLDASGDAAQT